MRSSRARPLTISIQHAFSEDAFFFGVMTGVSLDNYQPQWMREQDVANVHAFRLPASGPRKRPVMRLPLPANDNLAPLG